MKRSLVLLITALCASTVSASSLWDNAVELYRSYGDLVPGRMDIRFEQYNRRDELVSTDASAIEIFLDESGEIASRVIKAERNGKDVTDERRDDPSSGAPPFGGPGDGESDNVFAGLARSPFDPAEQANVTITRVGPPERVAGVTAQPFEFEHRTSSRAVNRGTAWLAAGTGEPVRLVLTVDPLPRFVSDFVMLQHYARDESDRWVLRTLEFDGAGHLLFLHRRIESRLIFSEYFRSE